MSQDEEISFETTIDILDKLFVKSSWDKCIEYINWRQRNSEFITLGGLNAYESSYLEIYKIVCVYKVYIRCIYCRKMELVNWSRRK